MKPDLILRSDMLDIIFEHRNKDYGAYALRRGYNSRLLKGIGGMLVFSAGLWIFSQYRNTNEIKSGLATLFATDTIFLSPPPVPPAPKEIPPPSQKKVATIKDAVPIIDPTVAHSEVPTVDEVENKQIGTENSQGEPDSGQPPGPVNKNAIAPPAPIAPPEEIEPEVRKTASVMPRFPGGEAALQRWLSRQLRPQEGQQAGQRIKVIVHFVVDKSGEIDRIELVQSGGDPFDQEVLRVIHKMPRWEAGEHNGRKVAVWFSIPIIFETTEQ